MSWKIVKPSEYIPVTDPDLKSLYDYFSLKRAYLWDEVGHMEWGYIYPEYKVIESHIKTIEKLQKELNKPKKDV